MGFDANFCMSSLFDGEDRDPMLISLQNTTSHLPYAQGCPSLFLYYILGGFAFSLQGAILSISTLHLRGDHFNRN